MAVSAINDPIPAWSGWSRKLVTFRFISSGECRRRLTQTGFAAKMTEIQQRAAGTADMHQKTIALWKMENIGAAFLRNAGPSQTLNDPRLPVEILPISHCGIGISAVELADFRSARAIELIESFSNPAYRLFAYENVGAMLGVYEPDTFTAMARILALFGFLPIAPLHHPNLSSYITEFDPEVRRLISHGYGRMLYFKQSTLADAVRRAESADFVDFSACLQGMAFAYSMVNSGDLHRVWQAGERIQVEAVRRPFCEGLVFALEFWEWMAPGSLASLAPPTRFAASLIEKAATGVAAGHARGALRAFVVG
jgi:hypothetical protein